MYLLFRFFFMTTSHVKGGRRKLDGGLFDW